MFKALGPVIYNHDYYLFLSHKQKHIMVGIYVLRKEVMRHQVRNIIILQSKEAWRGRLKSRFFKYY